MTPPTRHPRLRRWRAPGSPALLALLAACSSGPRLAEGEKCRIVLHDARTDSRFVLVNEAFAPRAAFYSQPREEAATKVLSKGMMEYLLGRLEAAGLSKVASAGDAPSAPDGSWTLALTVERAGGTRRAIRRRGDPPEAAAALSRVVAEFREVYDSTFGAQAVENPEGREYFDRVQKILEEKRRASGTPQGG